jgi:putative transposase
LRDLDKAFSNFFRRIKRGEKPGYPKFKHRGLLSRLYFPKQTFKIIDQDDRKYLKLSKLEMIRIQWDREALERPTDEIVSCSIVYEREYWYVCLIVNKTIEDPVNHGPAVGIDLGVAKTVTTHTGEAYIIDKEGLGYYEGRVAVLQRRLARKIGSKKGQPKSKRWLKLHKQINRLYGHAADIRENFNHYVSKKLTQDHAIIAMEDLNIKHMTESAAGTIEAPGKNVQVKSDLNRAILRQGWGQFATMLDYKGIRYGSNVIKVDPAYTTQECPVCGYVDEKNVKPNQGFKCQRCGHTNDQDVSAAKNILTKARSLYKFDN